MSGLPWETNVSWSFRENCLKLTQKAIQKDDEIKINVAIDIKWCVVVSDGWEMVGDSDAVTTTFADAY